MVVGTVIRLSEEERPLLWAGSPPACGVCFRIRIGQTGWSLASDKPDDAGITIVRLLRDKLWLEQAGMSAKGFVKERFAVERMIDETLEAYGTMPRREGDLGILVSKKVTS